MNRCLSLRSATLALVTLGVLAYSLPAVASNPVPFKGQAELTLTGAVPIGENLQLTAIASGQATHLGRFTRTETVVVDPFGVLTGTLTFTAANGDELYVDVAGAFTSPDLSTAEGSYVFTGGTGRFQDASGSALFDAVANGSGFDITFAGEIEY